MKDHRNSLATARRIYQHYGTVNKPDFVQLLRDLSAIIGNYERACDEIDRLQRQADALLAGLTNPLHR